ncbi:MAG TPA: hypothetical protein VFZ62_01555 [Candidatus Saccharimonadales bacterium]
MVGPIGSDPSSSLLYGDKPVHATTLRQRADVLDKTGISRIAEHYRRRANEETARRKYNLFTKEERELWYAHLPYDTKSEFASEITDGALLRLREAIRHDCFDGFIVRQRFATGEVMIIGYVETDREVLYFPVTFWAPSEIAPVTAENLYAALQEKCDHEARQKADREKREAAETQAAQIERSKARGRSRLAWALTGPVLVALAIGFLWVLGWWGALPVVIMGAAAVWIWDGVRTPLNLYDVRHFLVKPLVVLCAVSVIVLGLAYAQFGTTSRVITICGPGQSLDVQIYKALDGTEYEFTQKASDQFYAGDRLNEYGYGRVTAEVERHLLFGRPVVTSLKHTPDNNSQEVQALCKAPIV